MQDSNINVCNNPFHSNDSEGLKEVKGSKDPLCLSSVTAFRMAVRGVTSSSEQPFMDDTATLLISYVCIIQD